MKATLSWEEKMMGRVRMQYARLLSMDPKILPVWRATVIDYETCCYGDPNSFATMYPNMIDVVFYKEKNFDLDSYLTQLQAMVVEEARENVARKDRKLFPTDEAMVQAYQDSALKDYEDLDGWLNEFLVTHFLSSPGGKEGGA